MNDLISRHIIKERMLKYGFTAPDMTVTEFVEDCLPPAQQWIPCSERLPEEKGEYLVTYHPCYWDDVSDETKVGTDSFRGATAWAKKKYQKVIAWGPLPEPWGGEQDDFDNRRIDS